MSLKKSVNIEGKFNASLVLYAPAPRDHLHLQLSCDLTQPPVLVSIHNRGLERYLGHSLAHEELS